MATIRDMPDRLNSEPVVFRGFTTPELGLAACIGVVLGLIISLPFALFLSWLVIPTGSLLFPLVFISFGGKWLARKKRGKPENYIWQMFALRKRSFTRRGGARRATSRPDRRGTAGGRQQRSQLQPYPGIGDQPAVSAPAESRHGDVRFPAPGAGQHARAGLQHRFPFL